MTLTKLKGILFHTRIKPTAFNSIKFISISDMMSASSAPSVRYQRFRYEAQSDITDPWISD
jgi:hypothetical protein